MYTICIYVCIHVCVYIYIMFLLAMSLCNLQGCLLSICLVYTCTIMYIHIVDMHVFDLVFLTAAVKAHLWESHWSWAPQRNGCKQNVWEARDAPALQQICRWHCPMQSIHVHIASHCYMLLVDGLCISESVVKCFFGQPSGLFDRSAGRMMV